MMKRDWAILFVGLIAPLLAAGCGSDSSGNAAAPGRPGPGSGRGGGGPWGGPGGPQAEEAAAVPVEVSAVERRDVASYIETNGALEAENEVDVVARTAGPVVELAAEEGMRVGRGQVLLRIDPTEARTQVRAAEVALEEAARSFERAKTAHEAALISQADYDQALAARDSAEAALAERKVQLGYTRVTAPFGAIVVERTVKLGDNVTVNQKLFRISDFDPLLCRIQVPEKELSRLAKGQRAYVNVDAWPGQRFAAHVLRISPVVDAATGTIRVTLEVKADPKLRPGMFASVFLETDRHEKALTIPKVALSLESLGDTVYVAQGEVAARRAIQLGYQEDEVVEVVSGLKEGESVIVVGQDGLSDGTPIQILKGPGATAMEIAPGDARRSWGGRGGEARGAAPAGDGPRAPRDARRAAPEGQASEARPSERRRPAGGRRPTPTQSGS
jgi:membrane fusion protein (multidrug efflux system)